MSLPERVALGTMHGKAAAIAPPLARLGIALVVPEGLDTNRFGTFTGETPRHGSRPMPMRGSPSQGRSAARGRASMTATCPLRLRGRPGN